MDEPSLMQALALHLWCKQLLPFLVLSRSLSFSLVLSLSLGFEPYYNHRRVQSHRLASAWSAEAAFDLPLYRKGIFLSIGHVYSRICIRTPLT